MDQFLEVIMPGYIVASIVIGGIGALGIFGATWFFGADTFGVWAFLLGWIPAGIVAYIGFFLVALLWPLAVVWFVWLRLTSI